MSLQRRPKPRDLREGGGEGGRRAGRQSQQTESCSHYTGRRCAGVRACMRKCVRARS